MTTLNAKQRKGKSGLTVDQERAEKARLLTIIASSPWLDDSFKSIFDTGPDGKEIRTRLLTRAFPPGRPNSSMVRCPICNRIVPPNDIEVWKEVVKWNGQEYQVELQGCADHKESLALIDYTPSPSAVSIREMRERHLKIEASLLPSAKPSDLRREIRKFLKRGILPK